MFLLILSLPWLAFATAPAGRVTHALELVLLPESGEIEVTDRIAWQGELPATVDFMLNRGLDITTSDPGWKTGFGWPGANLQRLRARFSSDHQELSLSYRGRLRIDGDKGMGGMPSAVVDTQGVYLDGASAWYPRTDAVIDGFRLEVQVPPHWQAISQGRRELMPNGVRWVTAQPQDDIYLVAGSYQRYPRNHGDGEIEVYLRESDAGLAARYLDVLGTYLDRYSALIGTYPYAKFAVVENPWQTGYGMPSFTLLGSRVMRLPFIPYTSLPHEVLHNWWGNGVWVDHARGNWCEGLTAYLADHLMKELDGEGADYRRRALQRYTDFASSGRDFPLREFVARHDDTSQAVGYDKSLMLFHMLRRDLGDAQFRAGLRRLWRDWRYRAAGFDDVLDVFEGVAQRSLDPYRDMLTRAGAPLLQLTEVAVAPQGTGYRLRLYLRQAQAEPPFAVTVPLWVTLAGAHPAVVHSVSLTEREQVFELDLPAQPLRIDLDPEFDVLRRLDPNDRPPTLSRLFATTDAVLVLPAAATKSELAAWEGFARIWQQRYPGLEIVRDDALDALPARAVWLLGWDNRFVASVKARFQAPAQALEVDTAVVEGGHYAAAAHALALVAADGGTPLGFVGAPATLIAALAPRLLHYGSFSYAVFAADDGRNLLRGTLGVGHSTLTKILVAGTPAPAIATPPSLVVPPGSALE